MHEYEYDIEREEIPAATLLIPFLARQQGISSDQAHMGVLLLFPFFLIFSIHTHGVSLT